MRHLFRVLVSAVPFVSALVASPAAAFCGFYVAPGEDELKNDATMVVMMREGSRTVLSMRNDYQGPARDFAMVVPVPVVLQESDVQTLPADVFDRVDRLAAPRLVEYWEQDPCARRGSHGLGSLGLIGRGAGGGGFGSGYGRGAGRLQVQVEAQFAVGEYEIVILGADDSSDLETWLRQHQYRIPDGAAAALRPYVQAGQKFFVARVDASRVRFENGRAVLSPLRIHYDTDTFSLPVRLGMLNSSGTQDLLVHILSREGRFEVANYDNVFIPTNLDVTRRTRGSFGAFYAALFDRTREAHPNAVVTEYAWQSSSCDPCPGPVLSQQDLLTLGADVAFGGAARARPPRAPTTVSPASLPTEVVERIVRRYRSQLNYCFRNEGGRVAFDLMVDESGRVTRGQAQTDSPVPGATQCLTSRARRWRFPEPSPRTGPVHIRTVADVPARRSRRNFVLTRLHHRYDQGGLSEDLVFRAAVPMQGGREGGGTSAEAAGSNNFQGRYAIRHPWRGPIRCANPVRGVWGGPPSGGAERVSPAVDTARVSQRDGLERYLTSTSRRAVPAPAARPRTRSRKQAAATMPAPPRLARAASCAARPGSRGWLGAMAVALFAAVFVRRR